LAKKFDNVPAPSDRKWEDELIMFKFEKPESYQFRLVGDIFVFGRHWVATKPNAIESGKKFPRECTNFDPDAETHTLDRGCPACAAEKDSSTPDKSISSSHHYLINAIDRRGQEDGLKNPIKALGPLPQTLVAAIIDLQKTNRVKGNKDTHHVNHPDFGRDVFIKYNASATPRWSVSIDGEGQSPLTDAEKAYRLFDFDAVFPNFADDALCSAYNEDSLRSLTRCGYFENSAPRAAAAKPAAKPAAKAEPAGEEEAEEAPAPKVAAAKAAPKSLPKVETAGEPGVCPHEDQEDHKFGSFQASVHCMRCPQRMACMAESEGS